MTHSVRDNKHLHAQFLGLHTALYMTIILMHGVSRTKEKICLGVFFGYVFFFNRGENPDITAIVLTCLTGP